LKLSGIVLLNTEKINFEHEFTKNVQSLKGKWIEIQMTHVALMAAYTFLSIQMQKCPSPQNHLLLTEFQIANHGSWL